MREIMARRKLASFLRENNMTGRLFRICGLVQGVGFRFTNTNLAQARALTGWVRNMEDGSVEMEIQGAPANILSHLEALHASYERMGTRFRLVDAQARATLANEDGFSPHY